MKPQSIEPFNEAQLAGLRDALQAHLDDPVIAFVLENQRLFATLREIAQRSQRRGLFFLGALVEESHQLVGSAGQVKVLVDIATEMGFKLQLMPHTGRDEAMLLIRATEKHRPLRVRFPAEHYAAAVQHGIPPYVRGSSDV